MALALVQTAAQTTGERNKVLMYRKSMNKYNDG